MSLRLTGLCLAETLEVIKIVNDDKINEGTTLSTLKVSL